MKIHLIIPLLPWLFTGCISTTNYSEYTPEPPTSSHEEGGLTYSLQIQPKRNHYDLGMVYSRSTGGEPFRVTLEMYVSSKKRVKMGVVRISKVRMIMPDGTVYNALGGSPVSVRPEKHSPEFMSFQSKDLPLKFKKGARVEVEIHFQTGGKNIVIRRAFIGEIKSETAPIWEAWANV
jgi:hypothetical protein